VPKLTPASPDRTALDAAALDLGALLKLAQAAAREAGALVEAAWRKRPEAEHKGRVDLVTRFDRESEQLLRDRLGAGAPFAVVGEEAGGAEALALDAPAWCVDPIDGTTNFVHGHPFWCVSVGLLVKAQPLLGVVVAPSLHTEWAGVAGEWATRNGVACRVSDVARLDDALLATGFPYERENSAENNFDAFVAIKKKCQAVRRCGSAAIDVCLVADGTYDGYWENKLKPWDVSAGIAIAQGAGGRVTGYDGLAPDVVRGQIIATNGHIHDTLVAQLADVAARR
jgi:myo-inositol-1(or 4)-monophosphatase